MCKVGLISKLNIAPSFSSRRILLWVFLSSLDWLTLLASIFSSWLDLTWPDLTPSTLQSIQCSLIFSKRVNQCVKCLEFTLECATLHYERSNIFIVAQAHFLRQFSIMVKRKRDDFVKFSCAICLEDHLLGEKTSVNTCRLHFYCKESLAQYVLSKVNDAVTKIRCPAPGCMTYFRDSEVASLVTQEDMKKYKRFKLMKEHPDYRECSKCHTGTICGSVDKPDIKCEKCSLNFCFTHGDTHRKTKCVVYQQLQQVENDNKSIETIARTTRLCPRKSCPYRIEKNGGCSSVQCRCGQVRCAAWWLFLLCYSTIWCHDVSCDVIVSFLIYAIILCYVVSEAFRVASNWQCDSLLVWLSDWDQCKCCFATSINFCHDASSLYPSVWGF